MHIQIPPVVHAALMLPETLLAINLSGGKDGQAMLKALRVLISPFWQATIVILHMNLGRMEWRHTLSHCWHLALQAGLPFIVLRKKRYENGYVQYVDLIDDILARKDKLEAEGRDIPFWPSAGIRYCTKSQKSNVSDKYYRHWKYVISAEGIRADESTKRAEKKPLHIRKSITAEYLKQMPVETAFCHRQGDQRWGVNWYPIFDWSLDDVWQVCGTSCEDLERRRALYNAGKQQEAFDGWLAHRAYVYGADRVSCALCVLANKATLEAGARHNPELLDTLCQMEIDGGYTFKKNYSLTEFYQDKCHLELLGL